MANKKKEDKKLTKDQAFKKLEMLKKDLLNIRFKRLNNQVENPAQYSAGLYPVFPQYAAGSAAAVFLFCPRSVHADVFAGWLVRITYY